MAMDVITLPVLSFWMEGSLLELTALQYFHSKGLNIGTEDMVAQSTIYGSEYHTYRIKAKDLEVEVRTPKKGELDDRLLVYQWKLRN